jgi:predicted nucleic acid-binding protein
MATSPPAVTLDASFIIGYCAKEPKKYLKAQAELARYANAGWDFYAPAVAIAECLFVFCRKLQEGSLTTIEHVKTIQVFARFMQIVRPPPNGEASLIARAEQIRSSYGCARSSDSIYLALAEQLATLGVAEFVTFDTKIDAQAKKNAPTVMVSCLPM